MTKRALTTGEVAKYCGVNFRTVIRWIKKGYLKAYQLPGQRGDRRIELSEFERFARENGINIAHRSDVAKPKALIVDNEEFFAEEMGRAVGALGFEVVIANDGFRAGITLLAQRPRLMTLDLQMPGLSGIGVLNLVRSHPELASVGILVVSALPDEDLAQALRAGANGALRKPFDRADLGTAIEKVLGADMSRRHEKRAA